MKQIYLKLCFVGDCSVGKTCLIHRKCKKEFPKYYLPTVFESWDLEITTNESIFHIQPWDTCGRNDESAYLRKFSYPETDFFIFCFAIDDITSFKNTKDKWLPETQPYMKNSKILLVGTKSDLRKSKPNQCVTKSEAHSLAKQINTCDYIECSALLDEGVNELFDKVMDLSTAKQHEDKPHKANREVCFVS